MKTWMAGTSPAMTPEQSDYMHDIRFIRENPDAFDRALTRRGLPGEGAAADRARRDAARKNSRA